MRKILLLTLLILPVLGFPQNSKVIDMQGMTDDNGVTHLVYRLNPKFSINYSDIIDSDIYSFNTTTQLIDTLHKAHTDPAGVRGQIIGSIDFWDNNPNKFIRYYNPYFDYTPGLIERFSTNGYTTAPGLTHYSGYPIIISPNNPAIIYLSKRDSIYVSADSGSTWNAFSDSLILIAVNPFDEKYLYAVSKENELMFSNDTGKTFLIADENPIWNVNSQIEFDKDVLHLYAITESDYANHFLISDDLGKPSTWINKRVTEKRYYCLGSWYIYEDICTQFNDYYQITIDDSISGKLYLSEGGVLYKSLDYGNTLSQDTAFVSQISSLYLVPATDTLFVTTAYNIFKYFNKTIETLMDYTPNDYFQFYPLNDGDLWIYQVDDYEYSEHPPGSYSGYTLKREVIGDTLMNDGYMYKIIKESRSFSSLKRYMYLRIGNNSVISSNSYIYYNFSEIPGDLNYGDWNERSIFFQEENIEFWETPAIERIYFVYSLAAAYEKLVKNIGLTFSFEEYDFGYATLTLKAVFVNGVVYGDTSFVTSIEDKPEHPHKFHLKQNYPNPFNPETVINYELRIKTLVTLKVYDVSGKEITTLVNQQQSAGKHSIAFDGSKLASGVYFYRIEAGDFSKTRKMLLIR